MVKCSKQTHPTGKANAFHLPSICVHKNTKTVSEEATEMDAAGMVELAFHLSTNKATMEEKRIKHYSNFHRILLVGEGDFSFSACLARAFGSAKNMVATSLDSRDELMVKYPMAEIYLAELETSGCTVLHGVDAHSLNTHPLLSLEKFDRVVFNFPHSRLFSREDDLIQIRLHKHLVKGFVKSARDMLSSDGEIHVTHKTTYPYCLWELEGLAKQVGLSLLEKASFYKWDYPGYDNKRAYERGKSTWNSTFPVGDCCTFKFVLQRISSLVFQ